MPVATIRHHPKFHSVNGPIARVLNTPCEPTNCRHQEFNPIHIVQHLHDIHGLHVVVVMQGQVVMGARGGLSGEQHALRDPTQATGGPKGPLRVTQAAPLHVPPPLPVG